MKKKIVVASLAAAVVAAVALTAVAGRAAASPVVPPVDVGGFGVGSPVADFLALVPEDERPFAARFRPIAVEVPMRLFELDGHMAVKARFGRIDHVSIDLKGAPERVAAAVATFDERLTARFHKEGPDSWRSWYAADGTPVANLHVYDDALILILDDFGG